VLSVWRGFYSTWGNQPAALIQVQSMLAGCSRSFVQGQASPESCNMLVPCAAVAHISVPMPTSTCTCGSHFGGRGVPGLSFSGAAKPSW
jgi:hypothetical protein